MCRRCSRRAVLTRPHAPKTFRSKDLSRWRGLSPSAALMRHDGACEETKTPMTKMHRQSLVAYGEPLCETIVDCPTPRGSEVLVRVERCGVCHSDLHLQDGYFALGGDKRLDVTEGRALPFTLGHEIAGVVEAAGAEAEGATIGRRVAVYPWIGCGTCVACRAGEENL